MLRRGYLRSRTSSPLAETETDSNWTGWADREDKKRKKKSHIANNILLSNDNNEKAIKNENEKKTENENENGYKTRLSLDEKEQKRGKKKSRLFFYHLTHSQNDNNPKSNNAGKK